MVSVCMISLTVWAIIEAIRNTRFSLKSFIQEKSYIGLTLVFIAVLFSGINSEDQQQWLLQVKLKLPFLFLPFVFYTFRSQIDQSFHKWVHYAFIGTAILSSFHVIGGFLMDIDNITNSIGKGKAIPTPLDHIHYSIMMAYSVVASSILAIYEKDKTRKIILLVISVYLFGFMHFLSVRTGLAIAYAGIGITLIWFVISQRKYVFGLIITAILIAVPFVAFKTIEPFKRKINYMFWDLAQYQQGKGKSYSDSERIMSYAISLELIKEKPLFGYGVGDLRPIMTQRHLEKYGQKEKYIYPHNQYLYVLTTMGVIGALFFFFGLLSPLLFSRERSIFLLVIFALMLISFLVENTIQRAIITGFFLFFILLNLNITTLRNPNSES